MLVRVYWHDQDLFEGDTDSKTSELKTKRRDSSLACLSFLDDTARDGTEKAQISQGIEMTRHVGDVEKFPLREFRFYEALPPETDAPTLA